MKWILIAFTERIHEAQGTAQECGARSLGCRAHGALPFAPRSVAAQWDRLLLLKNYNLI